MKVAILGATSQIARDLIVSFSVVPGAYLHLFARRPDALSNWLMSLGLRHRYPVAKFSEFAKQEFDIVINFVGAGDPAKIADMGASIFDLTHMYDEMVLRYQELHPRCRYIFISSGAAYGSTFEEPANRDTKATIGINRLQPQDWYGVAKLIAECRHRAYSGLSIVDVRVFNYFSRTNNLSARFLITDILRAVRDNKVLETSSENIVRDYLHPDDFFQLITLIISGPRSNAVVDCYSRKPISKSELLFIAKENFGLRYRISNKKKHINASGSKTNYYSINRAAEKFGYDPQWSSLNCIIVESRNILASLDLSAGKCLSL